MSSASTVLKAPAHSSRLWKGLAFARRLELLPGEDGTVRPLRPMAAENFRASTLSPSNLLAPSKLIGSGIGLLPAIDNPSHLPSVDLSLCRVPVTKPMIRPAGRPRLRPEGLVSFW